MKKIEKLDPVIVIKIREQVKSYSVFIDSIKKKYYGYEVLAIPYLFTFNLNGEMKDVIYNCEHC